ncbi:ATP-dependent helicase HrpB [Gemmobacter megaterium]|uniref:ATP-dependent helicase HrpB n=1 Tax=Gemmobacter megaterium TaxID=1086013 RepID=A0A1N7KKZ8_9RHOB|nr:DEAD/DEAH box helicase [Gemmobacter megaterium]SIS62186.1 ATP-dependent helicase HrpB [Gemmobacter megaterium]
MLNDSLPIDDCLHDLGQALRRQGRAVLQAPPGAGKTTRVPLALLPDVQGRILMLEPRRLAARAAAERMAQTLGEAVGQRVGYRIRGESRVSSQTRIEVVTEGILTRMIQSDPELSGVSAVIFDEFHERSLNADLGLALVLEARAALRPDLWVLVMSATLDAGPVAALMGDAPLITSDGRAFPVETRWLPRPLPAAARLEREVAALVQQAIAETDGGVLVFLPGEGEIRRVAAQLGPLVSCDVQPLYGAMDFRAQRAALAPSRGLRKVVLATSIAETSLTIPDIRVVVDAGRARRARFDPGSGMSRLVTERVSRAEAEQRRGRAGRVAPGICYRLWAKAEEGALPAFPPPEIATADLAGLALDLALWGSDEGLAFLTPPPAGALAEARALLTNLGALHQGRITDHGRAMAALPLHPRLAHMLLGAGRAAAPLAALMADRDPLIGAPPDLSLRLQALENISSYADRHPWAVNRDALERIRAEGRRLARMAPDRPALSPGAMAAMAYPDRIGLRRKGEAPRWVLSGGKGATMAPGTPLAGARLLVATDLDGDAREAGIRQAVALTEGDLRALCADRIAWLEICDWSRREGRIVARRQERLGALVLEDRIWPDPPPEAMAAAALEGLRDEVRQGNGLPFNGAAARLRKRALSAAEAGEDVPPADDASLLEAAADWLMPALPSVRTRADLRALDLLEPFRLYLGWEVCARLDALYPSHFTTPLGRRIPIDYDGDTPQVELRLQELFGQATHPVVGPGRTPLKLSLLSPGGKPIAVTSDLPGFWQGSYTDVRKDMRGRYPRHPWPEDPLQADPTLRAKPRGT